MMFDLLWWLGWAFVAALIALPLVAIPILGPVAGFVLWALLAPWTVLGGLSLIRRVLPRSEAGTFRIPGDRGSTRWAMAGWAPSVYLTLFQPLFFLSVGFQRLALRAFGAKLGPGVWVTSRTIIREPHHVTIGARSLIGEYAHLICSFQPRPGLLIVAPISIGDDTLVSGYCHLTAGAVVGSRCTLEHAVAVGPRTQIGDDTRIGASTVIYGSARIGRGVTIGRHCVVASGTIVPDGARLTDGTMLPRPEPVTLKEVIA
jgi:acetyltransferase-like isoleucine patch superfamily enzyme